MQRALDPTLSDATETPAFYPKIREWGSLYPSAELHLLPNYQDSEHHLYANRHASKASDFGKDNALMAATSTSAM